MTYDVTLNDDEHRIVLAALMLFQRQATTNKREDQRAKAINLFNRLCVMDAKEKAYGNQTRN